MPLYTVLWVNGQFTVIPGTSFSCPDSNVPPGATYSDDSTLVRSSVKVAQFDAGPRGFVAFHPRHGYNKAEVIHTHTPTMLDEPQESKIKVDDQPRLIADDEERVVPPQTPCTASRADPANASASTEQTNFEQTLAASQSFARRYLLAICMGMMLTAVTMTLQSGVNDLIYFSAGRVGLTFTFTGSIVGLSVLLIRLYYPAHRKDLISTMLRLGFDAAMGSIIFGLLLFLLNFAWGLDPNFLIRQADTIPWWHILLDRMRTHLATFNSHAPINSYFALSLLCTYPIFIALYCVIRLLLGTIFVRLSQPKPSATST